MAVCNECGLPIQRLGGFVRDDVKAHLAQCGHSPNAPYTCPFCKWRSNPRNTFDPSRCRNCGKPIVKEESETFSRESEEVKPQVVAVETPKPSGSEEPVPESRDGKRRRAPKLGLSP